MLADFATSLPRLWLIELLGGLGPSGEVEVLRYDHIIRATVTLTLQPLAVSENSFETVNNRLG